MDPSRRERVLGGYIGNAVSHPVLATLAADPAGPLRGTADQPAERVVILPYQPTAVSQVVRATLVAPALWHLEE